jgi:hypothetical protein
LARYLTNTLAYLTQVLKFLWEEWRLDGEDKIWIIIYDSISPCFLAFSWLIQLLKELHCHAYALTNTQKQTHTYPYTYNHSETNTSIHTHKTKHIITLTNAHLHTHIHIHTDIHTQTYTHTHTHTHKHTHTHTHTRTLHKYQGTLKGEVSLYSWHPVWPNHISLFCK